MAYDTLLPGSPTATGLYVVIVENPLFIVNVLQHAPSTAFLHIQYNIHCIICSTHWEIHNLKD